MEKCPGTSISMVWWSLPLSHGGPSPEGSPAPGTRVCFPGPGRTAPPTGQAEPSSFSPCRSMSKCRGLRTPQCSSPQTRSTQTSCGWPGAPSGSAGRNWTSTRLPLRNLGGDRSLNLTSCHATLHSLPLHTDTHTQTPFQETGLLWPPVPWIRSRSFTHRVCGPLSLLSLLLSEGLFESPLCISLLTPEILLFFNWCSSSLNNS